jgi:hypothetical protein
MQPLKVVDSLAVCNDAEEASDSRGQWTVCFDVLVNAFVGQRREDGLEEVARVACSRSEKGEVHSTAA